MSKKVAILQSNYIPWKGYFDLINEVDEFIIYDTAQYTKNDWRNRNKIKTPNGLQWLTIPVKIDSLSQTIKDTKTASTNWQEKHIKSIKQNYSKASNYQNTIDFIAGLYVSCKFTYLSEINYHFLTEISKYLGINTKITWSHDYNLPPGKTERLVNLCKQTNATEYISGPAAKDYLNKSLFMAEGIKVNWMEYNIKPYKQLHQPFEVGVSIIDVLLNKSLQK